ncbi:hypothetical protein BHM03_00010885 [Ensete ventricosum]|nr:hypothetical protein BHM03_00010885 [Ensete ventricosum]
MHFSQIALPGFSRVTPGFAHPRSSQELHESMCVHKPCALRSCCRPRPAPLPRATGLEGADYRGAKLVANIATQVPVPDKVINLTLQVTTFLRVVAMFPVETTIPSFVTSFGACLHWIESLQKPPLPNLKEDLCSSRVEGYWRRSGWQHVRPVFPPLWWSRGVSSGALRFVSLASHQSLSHYVLVRLL